MNAIQPIPELPPGLREAAIKGTLIPFVGAGASVMAGCPNWSNFADAALRHFVEQGKFSHGQLAQLSHQHPRVKLSIALGLERKHNIPIDYEKILYPRGAENSPKGRRLYDALSRLGKTFVTTNYDRWLDTTIESPPVSVTGEAQTAQPSISGRRTALYNVDDFTPARLNQPDTVFHVHGSMREPRSMIVTTPHYVRHYANDRMTDGGKENNVLTFLTYLFAEKSVLFVGYGLEELEILEYVIGKARLIEETGPREMKHFLLQGFFSHEAELARSLEEYYRECGIELIPFLRDEKDWEQLIDVLENFGRLAPAGPPLPVQKLKEMEALLDN
jgi:hypothetical protein